MNYSVMERGRKERRSKKMSAGYAPIAGWSSTGSYVMLSPVLMPYVQAPVQYIDNETKTISEVAPTSPTKVRYLPLYAYNTRQPAQQYLYRTSTPSMQYYYQPAGTSIPYVLPVSHGGVSLTKGYISALTPPTTYVLSVDPGPKASHSELNPLSRPYTPPSKQKSCACQENDNEDVASIELTELSLSKCSTPDKQREDSQQILSKLEPVSSNCSCCGEKKETFLSDTDSGVEGESDEEGWCTCECHSDSHKRWRYDSLCSNDEESDDFPDLRLAKNDQGDLSENTTQMIDFVCSHLASHEWRTVVRELGVSDVIIQSVEYDVYDNFREQMKFILFYWARSKEDLSDDARSNLMYKALSEIGRNDLIIRLNSRKGQDA